MSLYDQIVEVYPELDESFFGFDAPIFLRNDSDGAGDYIERWDYSKPIPQGLKLGK